MQKKIWNPATCSSENGKYIAIIIDDSIIMCDKSQKKKIQF